MASPVITQRIKDITGSEVAAYHQLSGGCVSDVKRADLRDGRKLVIKQGGEANLEIEGRMLDYLGTHSPISGRVTCRARIADHAFHRK